MHVNDSWRGGETIKVGCLWEWPPRSRGYFARTIMVMSIADKGLDTMGYQALVWNSHGTLKWKIMSLWRKWHSGIAILNIAVKIASVHVSVCGVKTLLWSVERIWWNDNEKVWMNDMNEYDEVKMKGCLWMIYGGDEVNNSWIISLEQLASLKRDFCLVWMHHTGSWSWSCSLSLDLGLEVFYSRSLSLVIGRCWGRLIEWKDILHNHSKNRKPWQIT